MERAREIDASLFLGDVRAKSASRGQRHLGMVQGSCEAPNRSEIGKMGPQMGGAARHP